jgi:citronellol/citronellal dehydrogenase
LSQTHSFDKATRRIKNLTQKPDDATLLRLYSLFKQAKKGDAQGQLPIAEGMVAMAKWKAWKKCAGMSVEEAMSSYIELVEECLSDDSDTNMARTTTFGNGAAELSGEALGAEILNAAGRISDWQEKTVLVSGASRGIGKAIALRFASAGANLVLLARTLDSVDKPGGDSSAGNGSLNDTKNEVEALGGTALCVATDVRDDIALNHAVEAAVKRFGGIDAVVCNAGALFIAPFEQTPMKRYDLVHQVNVRATFALCQAALPFLRASSMGRILVLAPPISLEPKWLDGTLAYTLSKYGMSMIVLGLSAELAADRIAVNAMWPATTIDTAAVRMNKALGGDEMAQRSRKPEICAESAFEILSRPTDHSGNFHTDESALRQIGVTDFEDYAVEPGLTLQSDFYL